MATEHLYLDDPYGKKCNSNVVMVEFTDLTVDRSIFFPTGEGQPNDRGYLEIRDKKYPIVDSWTDGVWIHLISLDTYPQDIAGQEIEQFIDWDVRYAHMRYRSAMYLLSSLAYKNFKADTRINQTYDDQSWMDIYVDDLTEDMVNSLRDEANTMIRGGFSIENFYLSRDEFTSDSHLMDICKGIVPDYDKIRVCKMGDLPLRPDMGTQVKSGIEIGGINIKTSLVKGKLNKRITINLS